MAPPSTDKSKIIVDASSSGDGSVVEEEPDFLFEKRYDALLYSSGNGTTGNELNGSCMMGQLLMRGYEQELMNGYVCLFLILFVLVVLFGSLLIG